MKNNPLLLSALIIMSLIFSNCKKSVDTPPTTALSITVLDELGNKSTGANVSLYSTQTDWVNQTNAIGAHLTTDANGVVKFDNLSAIKYYWLAVKDCKNNFFGSAVTSNSITLNVTTTVSSVLASTGALKLTSNSSNPYHVYIDGTLFGDIAGNTTQTIPYYPTGTHTIRVLQVSGYVSFPTDQTYSGSLTCGAMLTTTFPN